MVVGLRIGVPWVMCKQDDFPDPIISTCNGFYCDYFSPNKDYKPKIWTEAWTSWFTEFGGPVPSQSVKDLAFAVTRFIQKGGSFINYYMYHGGTTSGRTAGGPFIATGYGYDAPLDEYGQEKLGFSCNKIWFFGYKEADEFDFPVDLTRVYTGQKESKSCLQNTLTHVMGKSRNSCKGNSTKFVHDYRHAMETMAVSEGFGSSGRVDTEMTLSEDSFQPQRKCISLNVDGYDRFGVPTQVISLSKMSKSERKDLELKLKRDLVRVQLLQKKVASATNAVVLSPVSDIRSCSDGLKRPVFESTQRAPEQSGPGLKRVPLGNNGPHTKRGLPGRVEPVKQALPGSTSNAMLMKQCENLLNQMMSHQFGWVFNAPVDVVKLNILDYFTIIKHPMDLGTIKGNIGKGEYSSPMAFAADVRLTFSNAMTYNPPGQDVHYMAKTLSKFFEVRWRSIEKRIHANADVPMETETFDEIPPMKKKKVQPKNCTLRLDPVKRILTDEDKHKLSMELEALLAELPESIIEFLKQSSSSADQTSEDEIEIDIYALSDNTLFKLRKLLDDYFCQKGKNLTKAEPCEMELHNESGFSNSSMQPCKENDAADEDLDIGGHDPPVSSFPPVEIERDTAHKNKNSCSASRESGSSSSDSESGSSSGSEIDGVKSSLTPVKNLKDTAVAEANLDQNRSDLGTEDNGTKQSQNSLIRAEQNAHTKPPSIEVDGHKEGESAPSERQVSPEKLYRAALLRSRFADTILKAQEKTLGKGEKQDPERVRLVREELERRQREEKARLQAEAKAAEEARKKAEAEAAAEAKRKGIWRGRLPV
ncbi:hypothetical protein Nepgr_003024 [Nepenthes gracilis]|uniref:beta-galactosidase n=1 Tax=Nepenthes gracilis TaxID=150966 RepID=A0AAD3XD52_NEPGR|nr:hypothetical protein Nepgr_003024 [Nepenthes gracilis]